MSQAELADRCGTTQSAIARLERGDSNPTIATVERTLRAAGFAFTFELTAVSQLDAVVELYKRDVDRTLLRENLRMSVAERLRTLGEWQVSLHELAAATAASKRKR